MKVPPRLIKLLIEEDRFLITTHLRPDGDAIGSQLALAAILARLGKEVIVENESPIPRNFVFLPGADLIRPFRDLPFQPRVAVVLDAPGPHRAGRVEEHLAAAGKLINIDHHVSNSGYGDIAWVEPTGSSVGEMIYHLLPALGIELDHSIALCIYVAILTDMGKFQYMVTPQSGVTIFTLAARLVEKGLVPYEIYKKVYNVYSIAPLKLLGEALSSLAFAAGNQIAYLTVNREMLERNGADFDITESLIAYPRDIISTRIAILFIELTGGVKVSFRSKEPAVIDVNWIAARFGGGGHPAAAGAELAGPLSDVIRRVLKTVEKYLAEINVATEGS